jgi:hypothetical protein
MIRIGKRVLAFALVAALFSGGADAQSSGGKKLYKWVDEKGNVYYSDKVPPDQIQHGRQELNSQGVVTGQQDRALSEAERAAKREREAAERRAALEAKKKADEEKRFLDSYATEDDLHRAFQLNLDLLAQQIASSRKDIEVRQTSLDRLMGRAGEIEAAGKKVDPGLQSMIDSERRAIAQQTNYLAAKEQEKKLAESDYQAKLKRYRELSAARAAGAAPKTPPKAGG